MKVSVTSDNNQRKAPTDAHWPDRVFGFGGSGQDIDDIALAILTDCPFFEQHPDA